jgi:predicted Zn-dependent peptidase
MKHTVFELTLHNGAKGLLIHIPDASVMTFELNFRAGEYLVKRNKWEAPHLMEHILLGANELYPRARDFQAELEKNGAYGNASTGTYDITYEAECADFEWDRVFGLLLVAITQPLFLAEEFQAEFGNVREELTARSNNHFRHLSLSLREKYGFKVMTDQERLLKMENVTLEDVQEHYKATHTSDNLRFVIGGNLNTVRRSTIKKLLSNVGLPSTKGRRALPDEQPKPLKKALYIHNESVENLYFYVDTFMHRRMHEAEVDALSLANIILTETFHSRIFGTARERGLVYGMSSHYGQAATNSNWWFGAQVLPKNARPLIDIMISEIRALQNGQLSKVDFEAAKQYALGRYQRSAQTVGGTASGYAARYFFDEVIDDYYKVPQRIAAVEKDQLIEITNALFDQQVGGLGVLGSCGDKFTTDLNKHLKALWTANLQKA